MNFPKYGYSQHPTFEPKEKINTDWVLHNDTAITKLTKNRGKYFVNNFLHIILLPGLLLALLVVLIVLLLLVLWLLAGISTTAAVVRLLLLVLMSRRHISRSTGQIHIDPTSIVFHGILQPEFLADLFDTRLDLLDMINGVISLADDAVIYIISYMKMSPPLVSSPAYTCKCVCPC